MIAELERSIAALFGAEVAVAVLPTAGPHPALFPVEERAVARAVAQRRAEFTAGRAAARIAMQRLGLPPQAVPAAPDRSPSWPAGLTGSISHAGGFCAAVLSRAPAQPLGLDIEEAAPLDPYLWPLVLTPGELAALDLLPDSQRGATAKRVFGIKEAAYKAQFPLTGAVIGFQALEVMPDPAPQTGIAHLRATQIGSMVPGLAVLFPKTGRICRTDGPTPATRDLLIAAISLPR
jgi:4'-phosphopantetheinyl transferase EntD